MIFSYLRIAKRQSASRLVVWPILVIKAELILHAKSWLPKKKSKHRPLSRQEKASNQHLARGRIDIEHVIGKLKVFAILCQRYRNRRRRFSLRFNLIAAIYNLELKLKS